MFRPAITRTAGGPWGCDLCLFIYHAWLGSIACGFSEIWEGLQNFQCSSQGVCFVNDRTFKTCFINVREYHTICPFVRLLNPLVLLYFSVDGCKRWFSCPALKLTIVFHSKTSFHHNLPSFYHNPAETHHHFTTTSIKINENYTVVVKWWWPLVPGWLPAGNGNISRKINVCGRVWGAHRKDPLTEKKNPLETSFNKLK